MTGSIEYLYIFLQSNLIEVPIYYIGLNRLEKFNHSLIRTTAVNSLTHPIVFFVIMNLRLSYMENILLAETFAILAETGLFMWLIKVPLRQCFLVSLIANLISWQLAPALTYLLFR